MKPTFSIIIPLYKRNFETLDNCIKHIKEQDFKRFEVILVHNSPNDESQAFIQSKDNPLRDQGLMWTQYIAPYDPKLGNGNHCRAFNLGAEKAVGDYLVFLDPDCYLYPGILREWKDAFDQHPGVDFVYGDYDFENNAMRLSRMVGTYRHPYSEYELKCANYISGAFPIKKSAFKGWDEHLESLQDWDMRLSAVDKGATGFDMGRPSFITAIPQPGGISDNQAKNWKERYSQIRAKHGFPVSETVVTSLGAPAHATAMAEILGVDTRVVINLPIFKPHDYKNIYLLGFYPEAWQNHMRLFYDLGDFKKEVVYDKKVIHWIGTDIYQMQHKLSWMAWQNVKGMLNDPEFGFTHLCEADFTQKELAELGIKADVVPLPTKQIFTLIPYPKDFTVGVYINPTQDMYYEEFMYEIAEAMPEVKFKFFGNPNMKDKVEDNKEWVGFVKMNEFLPTISALVRLTIHDGLPISPIEAIQAGRNVLASVPLKHALHAKYKHGEPDQKSVIRQIKKLQTMPLNILGSEHWRKEMSHDLYRERMKKYL